MKLERSSKVYLSITKSKAKMYEFGVEEEHHINLTIEPQKLLLLTIGILGDLSAIEASHLAQDDNDEEYLDLKNQLIDVSQYFDSLNNSRLETSLSDYLNLLGSASYYLADMPGSSLVLIKAVDYDIDMLTPSYIEGVLIWLLKGDLEHQWYILQNCSFEKELEYFTSSIINCFKQEVPFGQLDDAIRKLRKAVYEGGNDRELLMVDILSAIAKRKLKYSSLICLPKYTGLAINFWQAVLAKDNFIKEFWPAQRLLGEKGIFEGKSAVVQMPTSAGKTKSTELIIRSSFLSKRSNLAIVVAPFRALCREIADSFKKSFSNENIKINELQDVPQLNSNDLVMINDLLNIEGGDNGSDSVIVSTPEKLVYLLRHEPELASNIGLLIFDEGHQFDSGSRGITYELLLASLKANIPVDSQLILISAVMSNAETIGDWLYGENGTEVKGTHCLPTIRSTAFASSSGKLQYIDKEFVGERDFFVPRIIEQVNLGTRGAERNDRLFPKKGDNSDVSAYLGIKLAQQSPTAIFCGTKSIITSICKTLVDHYSRGLDIPTPLTKSDKQEISKIANLSRMHFADKSIFPKAIDLGILPHGSNVPNGLRVSAEWSMENNKASLVVCTSTLAQGVNLPIKYLIISNTSQGKQKISTRDFHNLIGRAGRSGYHTEGSVIFANTALYDERFTYVGRRKWQEVRYLLDPSNSEDCVSSLKLLIEPIIVGTQHLEAIKFIGNPTKYRKLCLKVAKKNGVTGQDLKDLLFEINNKQRTINALESYMMSFLKDSPEGDNETVFLDLAQGTLAHHLCSEKEKLLLIEAFELIYQSVMKVDPEKLSFYGKALLGIEDLIFIEEWLEENYEHLCTQEDIFELFKCIWPLLLDVCKNDFFEKLSPLDLVLEASCLWISGASYSEIFNFMDKKNIRCQAGKQFRKVTMDQVVKYTDNTLGYDAMLIVGALADLCNGIYDNGDLEEKIKHLQNSLKLGLSDDFELWLYSKGYVDREICKQLAKTFISAGVNVDNFQNNVLLENAELVQKELVNFPTYFTQVKA
ncbi:DEAD/DEAH box helicase [Moritella sp.]|uniref:DEAD/DEAH box helicase n=1 Tax=Moritella sp. TaxID=78556 RepID=UPI001D82DA70|nr:DEAD/DEAH box helicase [Moritella sp.]MCJ8351734.1 DEAD/DEAH box helicase [Moritella sp.]NQZ41908.1 DEAD/DEAH box helicase [Moritella sp.]